MKQPLKEHKKEEEENADLLTGWPQIGGFLGQPSLWPSAGLTKACWSSAKDASFIRRAKNSANG